MNPRHVFIDFDVSAHSVTELAQRDTTFHGMTIIDGSSERHYAPHEANQALRSCGDRTRVYSDAVFARAVEQKLGLPSATRFDDVRTMLHLLEPEPSAAPDAGKKGHRVPAVTDTARSLLRARQMREMFPGLAARLDREALRTVYEFVEVPVIDVTRAMIQTGVPVAVDFLDMLHQSSVVQVEIINEQLQETAGRPINPDSAPDVRTLLYDILQLPLLSVTTNGPAIDNKTLVRMVSHHPAVAQLLRYREVAPIARIAQQMLECVSPVDARIHAHLDQLGTVTGRYACNRPALQALPAPVLGAFRAADEHVILEADLSQTELRVLAHVSQDPQLMAAFAAGMDVHRQTAALAKGIPASQITDTERNEIGKRLNFAIIYGTTPAGLARELDVSVSQAASLLEAYFAAYSGVRHWIDLVHQEASGIGCVRTIAGRRRLLPGLYSTAPGEFEHARRQAINTVIQGSAADLLKVWLARLHAALPADAQLLLTVHDSVLLHVPFGLTESVCRVIHDVTAGLPWIQVPFHASISWGKTWLECKQKGETQS